MAGDDQTIPSTYACRCLNIRINTTVSPSERPDYPSHPNYSSVFVNDDGIQVNHPQATVRPMSRPVPIPNTSKHSRFTALTCLFCAMSVYRVHHAISLDIEGNSTTFLPSEEWVEKDILKTGTGWIDVHKDCLTGDDVAKALSATSYVSLFAMTLPGTLSFPPSPESNDDTDVSPQEQETETKYLPEMRPVFLPPPFTPSNQVFIHLAAMANKQSQNLRSEAEERIRNIVKAEAAEILEKEQIIKSQVLSFWKEFKRHLDEFQLDMSRRNARSPTRLGDPTGTNGLVSARGIPSSVAVRSFAPTPLSSSVRHVTSPLPPRISALSASLATSTFHYPKESRRRSSNIERTSPGSSDEHSSDSRSASATRVPSGGEEANVLQFRRTINDDINTQASYRYFVNLEEEIERSKHAKAAESNREMDVSPDQREDDTPSATSKPVVDTEATTSEAKQSQDETSPPRGRDKGKKKVTFDVKPAVVAIENAEKAADAPDQEAIFSLDAEEGMEVQADSQNTLPLLEQPPPRPITIKRRSLTAGTEVFQSLRPISLPAPSHIRPLRSPPGVDSSHGMLAPLNKAPLSTKAALKVTSPVSPSNENEKQSHGGAQPSGSNWNILTGNVSREDPEEPFEDDDEDEDHTAQSTPVAFPSKISMRDKMEVLDLDSHIVGSLPIKIRKAEPPKPLSLASYVGQDEHPPELAAPSKQSASAIRKAAYLEKDRARAIDYGALTTVVEDDEDDEEEGDDDVIGDAQDGEKARLQALRILQARSELPEEGMWRSLA